MKTPTTPPEALEARKSEHRFDALLEERFGEGGRREMASRIAAHDRDAGGGGFDPKQVARGIRFHGEIPDKVKATLRQWLPEMVGFAAEQGLLLRDLTHELHFFQPAAFEAEFGPMPQGLALPASSFAFNQLYRSYTVRVVLPPELKAVTQLLAVLRAALARLFGDIYLREEVFSLEAYREDAEEGAGEITVGLAEKIQVLAGETVCPPPLEQALREHARAINLNYKRVPDQVRKDFFRRALAALEEQKLKEMEEAAIEGAFRDFLAGLQADLGATVAGLVGETEKANAQLNFLPPDDLGEYQRLRASNPAHYLRAAKFRLNYLIEAVGGFLDAFAELDDPALPASPMIEEQIEGYLAGLRSQGLARPYLVPDVQLSEELAQQKAAFPFEVNAILQTWEGVDDPGKAFKTLSNRLAGSFYQRLYHALLLANAWMKAHLRGQGEPFRASEKFATLKGQAANFRFRKPLLEALYVKMGIVLELAEKAGGAGEGREPGSKRFPLEAFRRAWNQFVPHALVAGHVQARGGMAGFDFGRYWEGVEAGWHRGAGEGEKPNAVAARLSLVLREMQKAGGTEGLSILGEIVRQPTGTFRFVTAQVAAPPPGTQSEPLPDRLAKWAALVRRARETTLENAIVVGGQG